MSFEYEFEFDDDEVYFAYCIPYTYSDLLDYIKENKNEKYMVESKLGVSLGGLDIPLLTITDFKEGTSMD